MFKDPDYLEFVREQRCCVLSCTSDTVEAHHMITRGAGGGDYTAVPLCPIHHSEWHKGAASFKEKYGIDLYRDAMYLLNRYLNGVK